MCCRKIKQINYWFDLKTFNALFWLISLYGHSLNSTSCIWLCYHIDCQYCVDAPSISAEDHSLVNEHMAQQLAAFSTEYDFISPETDIA